MEDMEEKFILKVQEYECLWNSANKNHKNTKLRNDLWTKLSQELGIPGKKNT